MDFPPHLRFGQVAICPKATRRILIRLSVSFSAGWDVDNGKFFSWRIANLHRVFCSPSSFVNFVSLLRNRSVSFERVERFYP
jgi:hypothetical protein